MLIIYFTHGKRDQQRKKLRKTRIKANHERTYIPMLIAEVDAFIKKSKANGGTGAFVFDFCFCTGFFIV